MFAHASKPSRKRNSENSTTQQASCLTVSNGVGERHDNHGQEGRDRLIHVIPPDLDNVDHHQCTNKDDGWASCKGWNGGCTRSALSPNAA